MDDGVWQYRFIDEAIQYAELAGFTVSGLGTDLIAWRSDMAPGSEFRLVDQEFNGKDRYAWSR